MKPVRRIEGRVAVLDRPDVDTDQIMPKQFLKRVERTGFGEFLFYDWRNEPGWDLPPNPILATGANFGCGSSREHAVWALKDYGFKVVLSARFADIFRGNSAKDGLLTAVLDQDDIELLWKLLENNPEAEVTVDLEAREVRVEGHVFTFEVDDYTRWRLLEGLDDISLTLRHGEEIDAFEGERPSYKPRTLPAAV